MALLPCMLHHIFAVKQFPLPISPKFILCVRSFSPHFSVRFWPFSHNSTQIDVSAENATREWRIYKTDDIAQLHCVDEWIACERVYVLCLSKERNRNRKWRKKKNEKNIGKPKHFSSGIECTLILLLLPLIPLYCSIRFLLYVYTHCLCCGAWIEQIVVSKSTTHTELEQFESTSGFSITSVISDTFIQPVEYFVAAVTILSHKWKRLRSLFL